MPTTLPLPMPMAPGASARAKALGRSPLDQRPPLRGGGARRIGAARAAARAVWGSHLAERLGECGLSNREIAQALENASERFGAEVRAGAAPVTPGEVALLLPIQAGVLAMLDAARDRVLRELLDETVVGERRMSLRLALTHFDALAVLLCGR